MKNQLKTIALSLLALSANLQGNSQSLRIPPSSSKQTIVQGLGLEKIELSYSRPNLKGREIFGKLEPYNAVWRTGADEATKIILPENVTIEGHQIPAGEYSLFSIPNKEEWTIILNKNTKQWGAYEYKVTDDVLRFKVKPLKTADKTETFTIQFTNVTTTTAQLELKWDNTLVPINISANKDRIDKEAMTSIAEAMKGDKKSYMSAAKYYYDNGKDLTQALEWINAAIAESKDGKEPWKQYLKARIQLKAGDKKGAATTAATGVKIAKEIKLDEYINLNGEVLKEATR